jgi:uncharacterized membrane-anchored protein YitT (DUF2179 family)
MIMRWPSVRTVLGILRDYAMMTVGALLIAVAVRVFLVPNEVVTGGLTGVAQLLNSLIGTPVGGLVLVMNVPLLIIGFRQLGGFVFGVRTLYAIVVMALAIDGLAPYAQSVTSEPLLYSLYGGLLDGIGLGLILRARGTTGGTDIVARLVESRWTIQPGKVIFSLDLLVLGGALLMYGPEKALLAVLVSFISSRAVDFTLAAGRGSRQALIITTQPEGITQALLHDLGRGVTVLEGRGGYTGANRAVLLCIVTRAEIGALKAAVAARDPQAFVVIGEADEVIGEGFRRLPLVAKREPGNQRRAESGRDESGEQPNQGTTEPRAESGGKPNQGTTELRNLQRRAQSGERREAEPGNHGTTEPPAESTERRAEN